MTLNSSYMSALESPRPTKRAHATRTPSRSVISMKISTRSLTTPSKMRQQQMKRYTSPSIHLKTPGSSFCAQSGDRYIPNRQGMHISLAQRSLLVPELSTTPHKRQYESEVEKEKCKKTHEFNRCLLSSLCDVPVDSIDEETCEPVRLFSTTAPPAPRRKNAPVDPFMQDSLRVFPCLDPSLTKKVSAKGKTVLPDEPYKVLHAPDMSRDYYCKLISWGANSMIAVALATLIFVHDPVQLRNCSLDDLDCGVLVTSVAWCPTEGWTQLIAVGYKDGSVRVLDTDAMKMIYESDLDHLEAVISLAWNGGTLTTGSKDATIVSRDVTRCQQRLVLMERHTSCVVSLKWNPENNVLASGGNDDIVCLWDSKMMYRQSVVTSVSSRGSQSIQPRSILSGHAGAVRAMDWCPHTPNILATGGGAADQCIKLWDTDSTALLSSTRAGAQITDLQWNPHSSGSRQELLSSHGYSNDTSLKGQMALWKHRGTDHEVQQVRKFFSHGGKRVCNIEMSPDGVSILTNGEDEALEFWEIFTAPPKRKVFLGDQTMFGNCIIR